MQSPLPHEPERKGGEQRDNNDPDGASGCAVERSPPKARGIPSRDGTGA